MTELLKVAAESFLEMTQKQIHLHDQDWFISHVCIKKGEGPTVVISNNSDIFSESLWEIVADNKNEHIYQAVQQLSCVISRIYHTCDCHSFIIYKAESGHIKIEFTI